MGREVGRAFATAVFLGIAALPQSAHALEARAVIERYVVATGGRAALLADTAVHVRGRVTDAAMSGTFEQWLCAPQRVLRIEKLGMLRKKFGFDGQRGWRTDYTSRKVGPLEGKDLEALRSDAWFESEEWARDTTVKAVVGAVSLLAGRTLQGINVTPPVGPTKTLWFDQKTGLLARITHRRDQYDWTEELASWKTLAGRKRATLWTIGMKEFPESFTRVDHDSVWAEAPRDPLAFSPPATTATPVVWLGGRGRVELPFRFRRGHVWVSLAINGGTPAEFILDTGAFNTCLDRSYASTIGLTGEGEHVAQGVGGYDTFGFTSLGTLRWAEAKRGVEVRDLRVGVIELQDELFSSEWGRTAGLLGYDVLSRFVVDIDFDREVITLHDPASYQPAPGATAIPMTLRGNIPTVELTLDRECKGTYIVDVGNSSVLSVGAEQVEHCRLALSGHKQVKQTVGGIGGAFVENVCRLDSLRLGPFTFRGPVVGLATTHWGGAGSKEVQGNVGTTVLSRFRCTFDYAHSTLWLMPGARYAMTEAFTRSGLWYTRYEGAVMVFGVVKDSPAAEAGLKVRDKLRSVNGRSIERWTPQELDRLLRDGAPGSVVKLTYERDLREETVELTLADVL